MKQGEGEEVAGVPGAPSEQAKRWVVGRDEAEARAAAEKKYGCPRTSTYCVVVLSSLFYCASRGSQHK